MLRSCLQKSTALCLPLRLLQRRAVMVCGFFRLQQCGVSAPHHLQQGALRFACRHPPLGKQRKGSTCALPHQRQKKMLAADIGMSRLLRRLLRTAQYCRRPRGKAVGLIHWIFPPFSLLNMDGIRRIKRCTKICSWHKIG